MGFACQKSERCQEVTRTCVERKRRSFSAYTCHHVVGTQATSSPVDQWLLLMAPCFRRWFLSPPASRWSCCPWVRRRWLTSRTTAAQLAVLSAMASVRTCAMPSLASPLLS
ncbi:hypothetical protein SETIT_8G218900v2 [Setaria italica]|uniref:Uncharacterized protein n=1 Tax=Setaria italica TaxID=4555 RepID=A0A368SAJ9_SETIT|nr:hypothetical protein SETIT_8G218900v2 [Setaria italica]